MERYEYVTATVNLPKTDLSREINITIPDGIVTNIGIVHAGNTENRIINLSILENNNVLIQPADIRFSERTGGSSFKDSLRPVEIDGGRILQVRLTALVPASGDDITAQILFMILKPNQAYR